MGNASANAGLARKKEDKDRGKGAPRGTGKNRYDKRPTGKERAAGAPRGGQALINWRAKNAGKPGVRKLTASQADAYRRKEVVYTDGKLRDLGIQLKRGHSLGVYGPQDAPHINGKFITSSVLGPGGRISVEAGKPLTAGQFANFVYQLKPGEELESWKEALYRAGFYDEAVYRSGAGLPGGLDPETVKAWSNAVSLAMNDGRAIDVLIEERIPLWEGYLAELEASGDGSRGPQLVIDLTNPTTLRSFLDRAAHELVGRNATEEEKARFVESYQSKESAFQSAHHAGVTGSGSTQNEAPTVDTAAEAFYRENAPAEVGTFDVARTSNNFLQLITGGSIPTAAVE